MTTAEDVKVLTESLDSQVKNFDANFLAAKKVADGGKCSNDQSIYVISSLEGTILALAKAAGAYNPA